MLTNLMIVLKTILFMTGFLLNRQTIHCNPLVEFNPSFLSDGSKWRLWEIKENNEIIELTTLDDAFLFHNNKESEHLILKNNEPNLLFELIPPIGRKFFVTKYLDSSVTSFEEITFETPTRDNLKEIRYIPLYYPTRVIKYYKNDYSRIGITCLTKINQNGTSSNNYAEAKELMSSFNNIFDLNIPLNNPNDLKNLKKYLEDIPTIKTFETVILNQMDISAKNYSEITTRILMDIRNTLSHTEEITYDMNILSYQLENLYMDPNSVDLKKIIKKMNLTILNTLHLSGFLQYKDYIGNGGVADKDSGSQRVKVVSHLFMNIFTTNSELISLFFKKNEKSIDNEEFMEKRKSMSTAMDFENTIWEFQTKDTISSKLKNALSKFDSSMEKRYKKIRNSSSELLFKYYSRLITTAKLQYYFKIFMNFFHFKNDRSSELIKLLDLGTVLTNKMGNGVLENNLINNFIKGMYSQMKDLPSQLQLRDIDLHNEFIKPILSFINKPPKSKILKIKNIQIKDSDVSSLTLIIQEFGQLYRETLYLYDHLISDKDPIYASSDLGKGKYQMEEVLFGYMIAQNLHSTFDKEFNWNFVKDIYVPFIQNKISSLYRIDTTKMTLDVSNRNNVKHILSMMYMKTAFFPSKSSDSDFFSNVDNQTLSVKQQLLLV